MSRVAFLGAGAMGEALMRALINAGVYSPSDITAYDVDQERVRALAADCGIVHCSDVESCVSGAEIIVAAVKPQIMRAALAPLRERLTADQALISIAPGITTSEMASWFEEPVPCVRVMPNTPCLVGRGASAICLGKNAREEHSEAAHRIFDSIGLAVDVEEKMMDAVTALSGSGPAYVFVFIEALSDAGVQAGLPRQMATQLAAQTVLGAAQMVLETGKHPGALKDMVTSPGGTTVAALHELERNGFRGTVMDAVEAAAMRSAELSAASSA